MRLETHIHTKFSHDSLLGFCLLHLKCRLCKIDYIAVTEHNNINGALEFQRYCHKRSDKVKVIVGEEVMTDSGEIIGLYLSEHIEPGMSPDTTIDAIRRQGGIVYVPHPYDTKRAKTVLKEAEIERHRALIDCIECYNGRNISSDFSVKQSAVAEKYGLTKVIGSDAHTVFEIGRNYMEISIAPDSAELFRQAVKEAEFHTRPCLKFCHTITKFARLIKLLSEGNYHELYRVINRKLRK